ncbi:hypothetical protein HQ576_17485, partial [bacterium]|nr:hypothetical protein [bacterium]
MLLAHGVKPVAVRSLGEIPDGIDVLVLGEGCLRASKASAPVIGRTAPEREAVLRFAERGGRVLVLAQEAYPEGLFDFVLTRQNSTMTFAARSDHPALRGVSPADLKFWSGGHRVATSEPPRPSVGGYVPIIVSGSRAGVANAPLLERRIGKGCIVFSQLESDGPIADRIRDNLLGYLASYKASAPKTAVIGGLPAYHDYLRTLGLRFDDLTGKLGAADLSGYSLIVCRGKVGGVAKLKPFVEAGGNVVFHRTPVGPPADAVCRAFGIGLTFQPYTGHAVRAEGSDPLLSRFLREDLYWLGKHTGIGWATTPLTTGVADAVIGKTLDTTRSRSFEAESWTLEGQIVEKRAPGVVFATVGSVTGEVEFPASGTYVIGLVASGSPAYGVFPQASITVGGRMFGVVATCATEWRTYTAFGHVEKGRHKVTVAFTNDGSNPPQEDRNLFLDRILVAVDTSPKDVTFLTSPPTVAIVRRGKGRVVLDQMRWDTESANARKAARYAAALFTEMGGDFAPRSGVALECEAMTPQEGMNHYRAAGATAHLACAGYVGTKVVIAAAGRYTMEVVASGTDVDGVFPHVQVTLDDQPIGEVQLTSGGWRAYPVTVTLPAGEHELRVHFTNDQSIPGVADRNLALDKVVFYRE